MTNSWPILTGLLGYSILCQNLAWFHSLHLIYAACIAFSANLFSCPPIHYIVLPVWILSPVIFLSFFPFSTTKLWWVESESVVQVGLVLIATLCHLSAQVSCIICCFCATIFVCFDVYLYVKLVTIIVCCHFWSDTN